MRQDTQNNSLSQIYEDFRLPIFILKTKVMAFHGADPIWTNTVVDGNITEEVRNFVYLGYNCAVFWEKLGGVFFIVELLNYVFINVSVYVRIYVRPLSGHWADPRALCVQRFILFFQLQDGSVQLQLPRSNVRVRLTAAM